MRCALLERLVERLSVHTPYSVQGVLRAPAEGEGGVAHLEDLTARLPRPLPHARAERRHGSSRQEGSARAGRRRRSKVSRAVWEARVRPRHTTVWPRDSNGRRWAKTLCGCGGGCGGARELAIVSKAGFADARIFGITCILRRDHEHIILLSTRARWLSWPPQDDACVCSFCSPSTVVGSQELHYP